MIAPKAGQKLPGKARAYTTTKHYLSAALRKTTLEIGSHDVELIVFRTKPPPSEYNSRGIP